MYTKKERLVRMRFNLTDVAGHVDDIQSVSSLPVAVGFGIKILDMAR